MYYKQRLEPIPEHLIGEYLRQKVRTSFGCIWKYVAE
jgi:hypothetical protein